MKSWAQAGEDLVIARLLNKVEGVTWIDVGAYDPEVDSVTKLFYDAGGHGINIEPIPELFEKFPSARPRDINLMVAVGEGIGIGELLYFTGTGLSTFRGEYAAEHERNGFSTGNTYMTEIYPLSHICRDKWDGKPIDFLKIDVEGWEEQVLLGMDFKLCRPKLVCIEATVPNTLIPTWNEWEYLLLKENYRFIETDGVNRYYMVAFD